MPSNLIIRKIFHIIFLSMLSHKSFAEPLNYKEKESAFIAAGYLLNQNFWRNDCDDTSVTSAGEIDMVLDLNHDKKPEVLIMQSSSYCYGNVGYHYTLLSKLPNMKWKVIAKGVGIPKFIAHEEFSSWPEIEVGGPSFCFPILQWSGKDYVFDRYQYDYKPCSLNK